MKSQHVSFLDDQHNQVKTERPENLIQGVCGVVPSHVAARSVVVTNNYPSLVAVECSVDRNGLVS